MFLKGLWFNWLKRTAHNGDNVGSIPTRPIKKFKKLSLMKARILKDKKKRKLVCKYERKRLVFKSIVRDEKLPDMVRWRASLKLARLPKSSSKVRIRNRCVVTGRPRGVYRHSRISRVVLRDLASMGSMNGVSKSSW